MIKKEYSSGVLKDTTYYISKEFVRTVNSSGIYDFTYVYHEGQLIAEKDADGNKKYYHSDHLGSTSLMTDSSGNLLENTFYTPFGVVLDGGDESRYQYEGKEFDSVTGQYDFHFRGYKSAWGKFVQPDSIVVNVYNPQKLNRYSFELNNPWKYKDSTGHNPFAWALGAIDVSIVLGYYTLIDINEDPQLENELGNARREAWDSLKAGVGISKGIEGLFRNADHGLVASAIFAFSGSIALHEYTKKVALANPSSYKEWIDQHYPYAQSYTGQQKYDFYTSHSAGVDVVSLSQSMNLLQNYGGTQNNIIKQQMQNTATSGKKVTWYYNGERKTYTWRTGDNKPKGSGWTSTSGKTSSSSTS